MPVNCGTLLDRNTEGRAHAVRPYGIQRRMNRVGKSFEKCVPFSSIVYHPARGSGTPRNTGAKKWDRPLGSVPRSKYSTNVRSCRGFASLHHRISLPSTGEGRAGFKPAPTSRLGGPVHWFDPSTLLRRGGYDPDSHTTLDASPRCGIGGRIGTQRGMLEVTSCVSQYSLLRDCRADELGFQG